MVYWQMPYRNVSLGMQASSQFVYESLLQQFRIITMNYLQINYQTWERQECYGLFDYSQVNHSMHEKMMVKTSGTLHRNEHNFSLAFLEGKDKKKQSKLENCLPIIRIDHCEGHFFINNLHREGDRQPLCLIVPRKQSVYRVKEGDKIRLGKAAIDVLRIFWKPSRSKNHYQQIKQPNISQRQSVFACSFYSEQAQASMLETNPACRFCYGKTIDNSNPFLAVCNCAGSAKYIHSECLVEWIKKRSGIDQQRLKEGVYYAYAKAFTCEVCHALYRLDRLVRTVFAAEQGQLEEYVALKVNCDPTIVYVIDLTKVKEILIGRSLQSTIVANQLSVSRRHCLMRVDQEKKGLFLVDLGAKFGTVVEVERAEIDNQEQYQKGRTKLLFRKQRKMSFFEKIGFCSAQQNLRNEGRTHH